MSPASVWWPATRPNHCDVCAPVPSTCARPETRPGKPGARLGSWGRKRVARADPRGGREGGPLAGPPPRPPAPPAGLQREAAAALGAGSRRAARSAEPELDAAAATTATTTCAAVIKVGRPRAAGRAFPVCAMGASGGDVRAEPPAAAAFGEGGMRGSARGGPGFQPLCVTLHKALLLFRPQFPRQDSGLIGGPLLAGLLGGAAPRSRLPTARCPHEYCLHRPPLRPAVREAHSGRGQPVPTGPCCGPGAPWDSCWDPPPLGCVTCWASASWYRKRWGGGHPRVPAKPAWACRWGISRPAKRVYSSGAGGVGGGWTPGGTTAWTSPT